MNQQSKNARFFVPGSETCPFFFHQEVEQVEQFSLQVKNMDDDIIVKFLMDPIHATILIQKWLSASCNL